MLVCLSDFGEKDFCIDRFISFAMGVDSSWEPSLIKDIGILSCPGVLEDLNFFMMEKISVGVTSLNLKTLFPFSFIVS